MGSWSESLSRWRHSRGFGVHSPYAFMIVNDIIRCRYAYYAYEDIDDCLYRDRPPHANLLRRRARFILRLANHRQPERVFLSRNAPKAYAVAVAHACPKASVTAKREAADSASLIIADARDFKAETLQELASRPGCTLFIFNASAELVASLSVAMAEGCAFTAPGAVLAINRTGIARVVYCVNL